MRPCRFGLSPGLIQVDELNLFSPGHLFPNELRCPVGGSAVDHQNGNALPGIVGLLQVGKLGEDQVLFVQDRNDNGNIRQEFMVCFAFGTDGDNPAQDSQITVSGEPGK
jgi:hypothetical protein